MQKQKALVSWKPVQYSIIRINDVCHFWRICIIAIPIVGKKIIIDI